MMRTLRIAGLDCPTCAAELETELAKIDGVRSVSVFFVEGKLKVDCDDNALRRVKDDPIHWFKRSPENANSTSEYCIPAF